MLASRTRISINSKRRKPFAGANDSATFSVAAMKVRSTDDILTTLSKILALFVKSPKSIEPILGQLE